MFHAADIKNEEIIFFKFVPYMVGEDGNKRKQFKIMSKKYIIMVLSKVELGPINISRMNHRKILNMERFFSRSRKMRKFRL